jgi:hypothetical protein
MRILKLLVSSMVSLSVGCAVIADNIRMDDFQKTSKAYGEALREARFEAASRLLDPSTGKGDPDHDRYRNMKIVEYEVTHFESSKDGLEVQQTVDIRYYRLDRYILQSLQDRQVWRYHERDKRWLLQTGLPDFK